jgi:type IV pilus assembly protein PilC
MPLYRYLALAENGLSVNGEAAAESEHGLRQELSVRGLLVQQIQLAGGRASFRRDRITPQQFALFNQEFMALMRAGLTVPDALALAGDRPESPALGRVLQRVLADVRNGMLLSQACALHPEAFDRLFIAGLRTAEKTGDLPGVLARHHSYMRHRLALRKKVSQALTYPMFLLVALAIILAVLFVFVLPRFVAMYADLGAELPWPTRVLMAIVQHMYLIGPLLVACIALTTWGLKKWTAAEQGRRRLHGWCDRLPWFGELLRISTASQLARSLSTLLAAGTPLVEAMRTVTQAIDNQLFLDRLEAATRQVSDGQSFAAAARATKLLPPLAARMVEVGEASGGLDSMLAEVALFYEEALDSRLTRVMSLLEPVLMLLMGVIIGGIIIVMYLPVFHVADIIQ